MTLKELLVLLRLHVRLLAAITLGATLVVGVACLAIPNSYTASISMQVVSESGSASESQAMANDITALLKTDATKSAAVQKLGMSDADSYDVTVEGATTTRIIKLSVEGPASDQASKLCEQIASDVSSVAESDMGVKTLYDSSSSEPEVSPSGPSRIMYLAVAFIAGLFVAIAAIVCMDTVRPRVHSSEEASELLGGLPVIGRIPQLKD